MLSIFQHVSDAGGYAYSSRLASPIFWACIWLAVAFCAIHAIRRARGNPAQKPAANYNLNQKLYHWGNFALLAVLALSGFYLFFRQAPVSPGPVSTDLWLGEHGVAHTVGDATGVDADTARKQIVAGLGGFATGRFTTPQEVATLVVLLASEVTANVTGANYIIDGGLIKTT